MQQILDSFGITGTPVAFGDGHINSTYCVEEKYVLQKLNTTVFPHPHEVMENIFAVTAHLCETLAARGEDPARQTLEFLRTRDGKALYEGPEGTWRAYRYIGGAHSETDRKTPEILFEAAKAIGRFQCLLADFDAARLFTVLPDFHNTPKRLRDMEAAAAADKAGHVGEVAEELAFVRSLTPMAAAIEGAIADGSVPLRVSHNDTKLNNVLLDDATGRGLCVIDLDTVMSGSYLHDFGDAIRFGASTAPEDCTDLDRVKFDLDLFEAFTAGYLSEVREALTARERELLFTSAVLMTLECGSRFLADHLNGDVYFHIAHPGHNLERARNQFALVRDMLKKQDEAEAIVRRHC